MGSQISPNRKESSMEVLKLGQIIRRETDNIYNIEYLLDEITGNWQIRFIIKCSS